MTGWIVMIAVALVLSVGYRALRYQAIRKRGHDVQWSSPVVRWARRLRRSDHRRS